MKEKISKTRKMVLDILFHTKKRELDRSPILLTELIHEIVSSIQPKTDEENILFTVVYPEENSSIHIDKSIVLSAFVSILENAVDACKSKRRNAEISFVTQVQGSQFIARIKDNGTGIAENKKEKIFSLFYSEKGKKGTGLGLFIAERSIKRHGGTITVDSQLNHYTEFIVTLPME